MTDSCGAPGDSPRTSFWRRRVIAPITAQLTQGVSPQKIVLSLAIGASCSLFPVLGTTTLLNFLVGLWLRLNQPLLQAVNWLLGPVFLIMIPVYVRLGEWLWRVPATSFSVSVAAHEFSQDALSFFHHFAWTAVYAVSAWLISLPLLFGGVYGLAHLVVKRIAGWREPPASNR
jgi:uncharacterized protein (DUF2062 family)